jgi:spore maturation protein CgeB
MTTCSVASDPFVARMAPLCRPDVTPLHQATDPERFKPDRIGPRHEPLFVGNSRKVHRRIVDDLADTTHELAVYGRDWTRDLIDPRFVAGENIPNRKLNRYYSSAAIVLNDHWEDMQAHGFLSNRLYDASACGAFVASDHVEGIEAEFDGAIQTYATRDELAELVARFLAAPAERQRRGEHARAVVLERHTFGHRVRDILGVVAPHLAGRRATVRAGDDTPPSAPGAGKPD